MFNTPMFFHREWIICSVAGILLALGLTACAVVSGNLSLIHYSSQSESVIPSDEYVYISGGSETYSYKVDRTTGALTALTTGSLPLLWFNPSMPWFQASWLSSYLPGFDIGGSNVQVYSIDSSTGALTGLSGMPVNLPGRAWNNDGFMDPTHRFIYYPIESSNVIYGFTLDNSSPYLHPTTWTSTTLVNNFNSCSGYCAGSFLAFDATGSHTYLTTTDGTNYYVDAYTIDQTTGALTPLVTSTYASSTAGITNMMTDPSGRVLFVQRVGNPYTVQSFLIGADGLLTAVSTVTQSSSTVSYMTFNPSTNTLYVHQDSGYAQIINVDMSTGTMTVVGTNTARADIQWWAMDPTNTFACALCSAGFCLVKFDSATKQAVPGSSISGFSPIACSFSRNGNFVFAANFSNTGTAATFAYDSSGNLTQIGSAVASPSWPAMVVSVGVPGL